MAERGSASEGRMFLCIVAAFAVIQATYLLLGVRFDASPLHYAWQVIDVTLLQNRLLESCLYLHSQPPGFNLFLGTVLKLFPQTYGTAFQLIYLGMGLLLCWVLYLLQRKLGVSRPVAFVLTVLFIASPSVVLYQNYLFYTFVLTVLVTISALLFHKSLKSDGWVWPLGFFFSLVLLSAIRSLFHLVFYVVAATVLMLFSRRRKQVVVVALVMLVPLLSLYVKNLLLFDRFTTSTWMGESAWKSIARHLSEADRRRLAEEGTLSELALIRWYSPLERYPEEYTRVESRQQIPVLSRARKSTGHVNYNHQAYIRIADQRMRDFLAALRCRPRAMAVGLASSWFVYSTAASDYRLMIPENRDAVRPVKLVYDHAFYGKLPVDLSKVKGFPKSNTPRYPYLLLLVGLPLLLVYALTLLIRGRSGNEKLGRAQRAVLAYVSFTILYVAFIGNLFESGENNRFRFLTDPMYVALLGAFLQFRLIPWIRRVATTGSGHTA